MMKKALFVLMIATFSLAVMAKGEKVLDSSSHRVPKWVYGMESGFIITSAEAGQMDMARSAAMQQVKERILSSIAEHVESETSMSSNEAVTERDIQSLSTFAKQIKTRTADIPFLNNISESYVEDYYWQKIRKANDQIVYVYHIKYPFSEIQIRLIIKEWKEKQELNKLQALELEEKLTDYANIKLSSMPTVEKMLEMVNEVVQLCGSLPENDTKHRNACGAVIESFKRQLGEIQIRLRQVTRESCEYDLVCGGKPVSYQGAPKLKSNCLSQMQFMPDGNGGRITYDFQTGCYEDELNYIEIIYTLSGKKISNKFYVK